MNQNKGYKKTSPNASDKAIRAVEQVELFDTYSFSPLEPSPSSKEGEVLEVLLSGKVLTQQMFLISNGSWRLAAVIYSLKETYGWAIVNLSPRSKPAKYKLAAWALKSLERAHYV